MKHELVRTLHQSELFADLDVSVLGRLGDEVEVCALAGGQLLIAEGDPGDAVFVVLSGRLRVLSGDVLASGLEEVAPGQAVGELALISNGPRAASVRAVRDSVVARIPAASFRRLVNGHPEVSVAVSEKVVARLTARDRRADVRTVAIVPAGRSSADTRAFCRRLAAALSRFGSVAEVGRPRVSRCVGSGAADASRGSRHEAALLGWLDGAERDHRFVVYRADAKDTEWTRRCVRQADRVFLVGSAGGDGAVGRAEVAAQETRAQVELVLLHRDYSSPPTGTAAWLESRAVAAHHHVSLDGCDDFDRLARRLAGRSVGVVLGGGGARGMVHLGVMKALEEAGMPVDAIGGTSIGAILGAGWAQGWDHEARLEKAVCAFVRTRRLVGFTFPAVALSSGKKISQLLRAEDHLGERRIEDLWRPFFCVSANLSTAQAVVHDRGPTWWAVRASASLPGVLPPVCDGHEVLVDGGVVENLPVDIMRARLEGAVIAVDVGREVDLRVAEPFDPTLSGWRVLGRRLNPFRPRLDVPTLVDVMLRSREVGARRAQRDALAARPPELLLRPPTEACDTLDFRQGCELIDAGYRYTLHQLERSSTAQSLINGAHAL